VTFLMQICSFYLDSKTTLFWPLEGELKILETLWGGEEEEEEEGKVLPIYRRLSPADMEAIPKGHDPA
jgi:hypothetical protein